MRYEIVYVILHYNSIDSTRKCVDSILELQSAKIPGIVIVDNASPNKTGVVLEQLYGNKENVKVILLEENAGFAKGNNAGYHYAKHGMKAECIICANNDVYFIQKEFGTWVEKLCKECPADVIGPDIRTYNEVHQNPLRPGLLTETAFRKKHMIKYGWLFYWKLRKIMPFLSMGERMGAEATRRNILSRNYAGEQEKVVLQGACILFMKDYVTKEEEAFVPDTFMYMEEDLLAYKCLLRGYKVRYIPKGYVFHAESLSTEESYAKKADKQIFYYRECLKSEKVLGRYIKKARQLAKREESE